MKTLLGLIIGFILGIVAVLWYQSMWGVAPGAAVSTTQSLQNTVQKAADVVTAEWKIPLGQQNNSGMAGFATLKDKNGQVEVLLALASIPGATGSAAMPAHIHMGSCPNPGEVKFPLTEVINGTSQTMINTSIASLKAMLPLAINVHQSATQIQKYVACGDLR